MFDTFNSQRNQSFNLAAAPEFAWPDTFNSGVFLFRPSNEIFQGLVNALPSYDGGDQGILNAYFGQNWARLSVNYNLPISRVENLRVGVW